MRKCTEFRKTTQPNIIFDKVLLTNNDTKVVQSTLILFNKGENSINIKESILIHIQPSWVWIS